ncbi:hypothetical protein ACFE04_024095 [Oxalis oulophora]
MENSNVIDFPASEIPPFVAPYPQAKKKNKEVLNKEYLPPYSPTLLEQANSETSFLPSFTVNPTTGWPPTKKTPSNKVRVASPEISTSLLFSLGLDPIAASNHGASSSDILEEKEEPKDLSSNPLHGPPSSLSLLRGSSRLLTKPPPCEGKISQSHAYLRDARRSFVSSIGDTCLEEGHPLGLSPQSPSFEDL